MRQLISSRRPPLSNPEGLSLLLAFPYNHVLAVAFELQLSGTATFFELVFVPEFVLGVRREGGFRREELFLFGLWCWSKAGRRFRLKDFFWVLVLGQGGKGV